MANEMRDAIKGNPIEDIRAVAEAGDTVVAANVTAAASAITALGTEVKGTGWEPGMTLKVHDDTISGHTTALSKLNGMYSIEFVGAGAQLDAAFCGAISVLTPGAVPAAGDKIIAVLSARATANMSPVAYPAIVDAATSDGFVQILELDYGDSKVKVKQGGGSDLSANTYRALVLKV